MKDLQTLSGSIDFFDLLTVLYARRYDGEVHLHFQGGSVRVVEFTQTTQIRLRAPKGPLDKSSDFADAKVTRSPSRP